MTENDEHELIWRIRHEARRMVRADKQAELKATMCQGKHRFATPLEARRAARRNDVDFYRCKVCGHFHTGTVNRGRRLAMQRLRANG